MSTDLPPNRIPPNRAARKVLPLLTSVAFFAMGLFFWWGMFLAPIFETQMSSDWVETQAEVVVCEIISARGKQYRPKVEFIYQVDGKSHRSERFDFTAMNRSEIRCQAIVDATPVGSTCDCFYDPENPEDAVIRRQYDFSFFAMLFPLVFITLGLLGILRRNETS